MFLFIGESLGMWELVLIGVVALIIFGPRKLPQLAKTIGKTMAEFRKATNEFKSTWEKEVDFDRLENEDPVKTIAPTENSIAQTSVKDQMQILAPEIKSVDKTDFKDIQVSVTESDMSDENPNENSYLEPSPEATESGKRDWL